jgi:hypothetical protein
MIFLALLVLSAAFVAVAAVMAFQLTPEERHPVLWRWGLSWFGKGLATPLGAWALMNLGFTWALQPFMPSVQLAQMNGTGWVAEFLGVTGKGMFVLSSYWAALTLVWLVVSAGQGADPESRKDFKALCLTCGLGLALPAAGVLLIGGWPLLGLAATLVVAPMAGYGRNYLQPKKTPPMYARAIARIKFGKYTEAEWEIIRELEKREDDFEGWMMLAELYANHFNDLKEAERTIQEIALQPKLTPSQLSVAFHRLADWQLKLAQNPEGARRALQVVCQRLPGTHLARMAQLRINQLPKTAEDLREQQTPPPIPLPALGDQFDEAAPETESGLSPEAAGVLANECVERLKRDPNHVPAREKLARLLAEELHKPELGIEQMVLLLNLPDQPEAKRAEWLGLSALWHVKYLHDLPNGRRILQRIIDEFPESPQAFAARRRLERLNREALPKTG